MGFAVKDTAVRSHKAEHERLVDTTTASVVVVEIWRLGPIEKAFPSKREHAARVGGKNRGR